ncbi:hypothetical protein SDC9_122629 [bioreactor metagenome]|uniref:Uncharacterized protein n=1 Tax=bioreactor metagenome TaxID=1076179 RepID=A0A645CFF8_9ZZZZ
MPHPETLLLVYHHQTEILERHIALKQPVGTDQNVDSSGHGTPQCFALFGRRPEPGNHLDGNRIFCKPRGKTVKMLLCQNCGRRNHRHLKPCGDHAERGHHGHFRLAESDVTAKQAVHRVFAGKIAFDLVHRSALVNGQLESRAVLERQLLIILRRQRQIGYAAPHRLYPQQIGRVFTNRPQRPGPIGSPSLCVKMV